MKNKFKGIIKYIKLLFVIISSVIAMSACNSYSAGSNDAVVKTEAKSKDGSYQESDSSSDTSSKVTIDEDGTYTSKEDVALYIYTYKKLPKNFITKKEAKKLGWNSSKNYVGDVAKGKSIGGDKYRDYEKSLPRITGRTYYECDIDYKGKKRNGKRIVYADDFDEEIGFIYYTDDHYKTFERLY